jgi:type II secretory pathway predicted ATPase ExeA
MSAQKRFDATNSLNVPLVQAFELRDAPFPQVLPPRDMYELPHLTAVASMTEFAFQHNMFYAVIGAVGCGKSSALQYSCARLAQRQGYVVSIIGGIWSFTEFLRQVLAALAIDFRPYQPSVMVRLIQERLLGIQGDGKKCILVIDEAHLLRSDVFAQIHILAQHPEARKSLFSLMLCGQEELAEKLSTPQSRPLMSRIAEGYYVPPITRGDFDGYIGHHMRLAGAKHDVFESHGARCALADEQRQPPVGGEQCALRAPVCGKQGHADREHRMRQTFAKGALGRFRPDDCRPAADGRGWRTMLTKTILKPPLAAGLCRCLRKEGFLDFLDDETVSTIAESLADAVIPIVDGLHEDHQDSPPNWADPNRACALYDEKVIELYLASWEEDSAWTRHSMICSMAARLLRMGNISFNPSVVEERKTRILALAFPDVPF